MRVLRDEHAYPISTCVYHEMHRTPHTPNASLLSLCRTNLLMHSVVDCARDPQSVLCIFKPKPVERLEQLTTWGDLAQIPLPRLLALRRLVPVRPHAR